MTHYEVLGIRRDASGDEVRAAYHRLARGAHPDLHQRHGAPAEAAALRRMQALNEAWRVLGDSVRRRAYDAELQARDASRRASASQSTQSVDDAWIEEERWAERERWVPPDPAGSPRPVAAAPVLLFAIAVGLGILWLVLGLTVLLAAAVGAFVLSATLMVLVPLLVMLQARKNDE